jgi:predicted amidohydrolase YtcJ
MRQVHYFVLSIIFFLAGCTGEQGAIADAVFINGKVYTVDDDRSWAEALAIRDGKFVFVGNSSDVKRYIGDLTKVTDLKGSMVMPGLHDAHGHLLLGGLQFTSSCLLTTGATIDVLISELKACAAADDSTNWLVAGNFWAEQFPDGKPRKAILDAAFPDIPVYLNEGSVHHALVNSKALEIAGIDRNTADPPGGSLPKDSTGELTGELLETATWLVARHIPSTPKNVNLDALEWAIREYNKYGFTSVQEASGNRITMEALRSADRAGILTLRVAAHFILESPKFGQESVDELEELFANRSKYASPNVAVDFVKMWIDGSPTEPYFSEAGYDSEKNRPILDNILVPPERLGNILVQLDQLGVKVKMHVAGAGAANVALNAIEQARESNPNSEIRHETGHSNLIIPGDFKRYRELGAVAEVSPTVWQIFGTTLGSPPQAAWQFRTLSEHGALITMGSDWPVTREPNFFPAIQGMLQHGEESIDLATAIDTATINGATSTGWGQDMGSIEEGKIANMIVLDQNIFDIEPENIGRTRVMTTLFEGQVVYQNGDAAFF